MSVPAAVEAQARRLVPELFDPDLPLGRVGHAEEMGDVRGLMWDLLAMLREARRRGDRDFEGRAFALARTCLRRGEREVWSPAGVGFYAKAARGVTDEDYAAHLTARDFADLADLLAHHLGEERAARIGRLVRRGG